MAKIKVFRTIACLLALLLFLSACQSTILPIDSESQDPSPTSSEPIPSDSSEDSDEETNGTLTLFADQKTEYVLVMPKKYNQATIDLILSFVDKTKQKTGVDLFTVRFSETDAPKEKEIIIGNVTKRPESLAMLQELSYTSYCADVVGQKLVVCAHTATALEKVLLKVSNAIVKDESGNWVIETDFYTKDDLATTKVKSPSLYETDKGYIGGVYAADEKHYTINMENTNLKEYQAYIAKLKADGFTEYATNQIGDNLFATFVATDENGDSEVHTMFYPYLERCNIVYGPKGYLPSTEPIAAPTASKIETTIYQLERQGVVDTGIGMLVLIQLPDASFIIIDGGLQNATDAKNLLDFMAEKTPNGGKPVIACWIITHAHSDHMGLANYFLGRYNNSVELKMVACNFPSFDDVTISWEGVNSLRTFATTFKSNVRSLYKNAEPYTFHTGQRLYLPGCAIDFLYTPEDHASNTFPNGNYSSVAFRIESEETSLLILGDCTTSICAQLGKTYKSAVKSDILQPSHHGYEGGDLALYQYVAPSVCVWPVDNGRYAEFIPQYDYNKWLLTNVKKHYTASMEDAIPFP